ncbi:hypothetical protein C8A05DRAFT_47298 [Staphylotrichum tortipilum]|uniref:FAD dependent oxidoreductase domain-containing protein n=1 Tax=Staphylotrichum tortipilum TaxID=2831512 RepID=A0AAN6MCQ0_9PEZI|nr:hypothetical protein C8A05DRAFT_47298 [Staphylotrichum longicolle]
MAKITILGAGITGLTIAAQPSSQPPSPTHQITIIARDLPADAPSQRWSSPWACAGWVALGGGTALERQMQLDALAFLRRVAAEHPAAGVRAVRLVDGPTTWFAEGVEGFEVLGDGLGGGETRVGYGSVVVNPGVFLGWLKDRLVREGVMVLRVAEMRALTEKVVGYLGYLEHDVLINASGAGARVLEDVRDEEVVTDRTYTVLIKSDFEGALVHRGVGVYTYFFGRGDGTAVLGGVSEPVGNVVKSCREVYEELFPRAHATFPEQFPTKDFTDYEIVEDLVGIRPLRPAGVRVEKEVINGLNIVHAYGTTIGGYIHSFGLAQEVTRLVEGYISESKA